MVLSKRACCWIGVAGWAVAGLLAGAVAGRAEGVGSLESVGVRGGIPGNDSSRQFNQAEAFGNLNLPWGWDLGKSWHLQSRLDLSAGWLGDKGNNTAIGTVGPSLVVNRGQFPVSLEGGISPTILSDNDFASKNFGTDIQFTSHLGLNWGFARHWCLSYRYQHMSNAGLASRNPGLNLHVFGLSYKF